MSVHASRLPNSSDAVILTADCTVDMDVWVQPASIDIGSYSLTLTSLTGANLTCTVTGTGSITLNGVNFNQ